MQQVFTMTVKSPNNLDQLREYQLTKEEFKKITLVTNRLAEIVPVDKNE